MKLSSIEETEGIYICSRDASINWHSVQFPELQFFTRVVQRLIDDIGELDNDDYWFDLIKKIRKFRFDAIAAPLTEDILQERLTDLIANLYRDRDRFKYAYPDTIEQYSQVLNASEVLKKIKISQLLYSLTNEIHKYRDHDQTAILVCETRFITNSEKSLSSMGFQNLIVTSPSFLREDVSFNNMIVFGPTRWYPDYIFSAPRAQNILIFKYGWIRDKWKHQPVFTSPITQKISKLMETVIDEPFERFSMEPDILRLSTFDFARLQKQVEDESRGHNEVEYVQAKFFLLEEDWGVLLEADENSSVHVIDLEDLINPVKKIKTNEVKRGMFVLLRTKGGGDFIVSVADQIMGISGVKAREYQSNWKSLLRSQVVHYGYDEVVEFLHMYGSSRANYINLHNWVSERNIKTENRNDFDAILKVVDLENESDLYWVEMERIDSAHRKAGHKIKTMLLDKVKNSDLRVLKRTGKINFELESENSISITAFQITDIYPDKIQALVSQLGDPIKQGD